jgi:hypothetical protein
MFNPPKIKESSESHPRKSPGIGVRYLLPYGLGRDLGMFWQKEAVEALEGKSGRSLKEAGSESTFSRVNFTVLFGRVLFY